MVERMTRLVARALGLSAPQLLEAFKPATAEHLADVVALRQALFGADIHWDDAAYLTWRYRFGSTTQGRGECWVLVLDASVAGMVGTEEIELQRGEERIAAWSTMDIAIDQRYEGSGLGSWMNLRLCAVAGCALTIGSNAKSRNMITRMFRRLPDRRSYLLPIRFQRMVRKRLGRLVGAPCMVSIVEALAALWRAFALPGARGPIELRPITRFGSDGAELLLWSADPEEWQVARSIEFLNWRLFGNPRTRYAVVGAYANGALVGYMATIEHRDRSGVLSLVVVDWAIDRTRFRAVFRTLCADAVRTALHTDAESVSVTAYHARSEALLKGMGFVPHFDAYETLAVYATDDACLQRLLAPASWFITEINTDRDSL
jgi:hypothetical protein